MLLGEYLCFERQDYERVDAILKALAPDPFPAELSNEDWRAIWLAGDLLILYRRIFQENSPSDEHIVLCLETMIKEGGLEIRERAAAADTLDELGWLPKDLHQFVRISPGADHPSLTEPFWIAKYPVTNVEYARFLEAEDFADPALWTGFPRFDEHSEPMKEDWGDEGWRWLQSRLEEEDKAGEGKRVPPRYWNNLRFGIARRGYPVVGLTWYEANAYCRWLGRHWGNLGEGRENSELRPSIVRLPLEAEWVFAAGGEKPQGRYAWDEDDTVTSEVSNILQRANVDETGIGHTTPVGMYPLGRSLPYGLWDLSGNVWEWQANYYDEDHKYLALRGGSWSYSRDSARVAERGGAPPLVEWIGLGFRVVAFPS
jgi:formylglycine-generating enzyme required for sulfatase activity